MPVVAVSIFLAASLFLNSRLGTALGQYTTELFALLYGWLRFDALRGLVRLVSEFFKRFTNAVESALYSVDEWLRFRSGESSLVIAVRAVLGLLWFPIRYLLRLYFLMLIEPTLNPLKLPISILAAKFFVLIPNYIALMQPGSTVQEELINSDLAPHIGWALSVLTVYLVVVPTLWLLPSAVAFFIWELTRNWRLFRANRPTELQVVSVGRYGETVLQLIKLGHHSGTIPRVYARLRDADREAYCTNDWRQSRACRQSLRDVARSVEVFVEREFVAILHQSRNWPSTSVHVAHVSLSCARIRIDLAHNDFPLEPVQIVLEERDGWLLGGIGRPGWLKKITADQGRALTSALAGFYRLSGVDFVRESVAALLPENTGYLFTNHKLVVRTGPGGDHVLVYDLNGLRRPLFNRDVPAAAEAISSVDPRKLYFSRVPLPWNQWCLCWQRDQQGAGHTPVCPDDLGVSTNLSEASPDAIEAAPPSSGSAQNNE
jgi:hypothetical protein